jgi:hypothetical protein
MNKLACCWCEQEFQTACLLDNFCSDECSSNYWKSPAKLEITSECPQCHRKYIRTIFSVECRAFQNVVLCQDCMLAAWEFVKMVV